MDSKLKNKLAIKASFGTLIVITLLVFFSRRLNYWLSSDNYIVLDSNSSIILPDTLEVIRLNNDAFNLRLVDPNKMIKIADSALIISKKLQFIGGMAEAHRIKGIGFNYLNDNQNAVKNYTEALKYFRYLKDKKNEARVYVNFGNLYTRIHYEKALSYFSKALSITKPLNIHELNAGIYFNISNIFITKGEYAKSLKFLEKCRKIFVRLKDSSSFVLISQNFGVIYYNLKDYNKAEKNLFDAISKAKKDNLYRVLAGSNLTLASTYLEQNRFSKTDSAIKEGIKYSKNLKDTKFVHFYLYKAYELELKRKNLVKALEYLKKVYSYDSLQLVKNLSDNITKTSSNFYQLQKLKENELIIAKQKIKETQYWWLITGIISIFLLLILIGITLTYFRKKKLMIKELIVRNTVATLEQKALQALMNPHFLFNIINTIQYFNCSNELNSANQVLANLAKLIRKHLEICLKNSITLIEEIEYLELYLSVEKVRLGKKMNYSINADQEIDIEEILIPPMLLQPFVENAIWHGIMPIEGDGFIEIDFTILEDVLTIKITDNGIGIDNSSAKKTDNNHKSRGLNIIQERIQLHNRINTTSIQISQRQTGASGTEVFLHIPV